MNDDIIHHSSFIIALCYRNTAPLALRGRDRNRWLFTRTKMLNIE